MKQFIKILTTVFLILISFTFVFKTKSVLAACNPLTDPYCLPPTATPPPGPTPTPGVCSQGQPESATNNCSWPNCSGCYCIRTPGQAGCDCPGDGPCGEKVCLSSSWCGGPVIPTPTPISGNQICGYIKDETTGRGVAGVGVYVQDNLGNNETVTTNWMGYFVSTAIVSSTEYYAVRPRSWTIPTGYSTPFASYHGGWSWNYCVNPVPGTNPWGDTPLGSTSFECQRNNSGIDCAGADASGISCRCSFSIPPNTPTPTTIPTATSTPTPTPNPPPNAGLSCTANSGGDCNLGNPRVKTTDRVINLIATATDGTPPTNPLQALLLQANISGVWTTLRNWNISTAGANVSRSYNFTGDYGQSYRFRARALDKGGLTNWDSSGWVDILSYIQGNFYEFEDGNVGMIGGKCQQLSGSPVSISLNNDYSITAERPATGPTPGTLGAGNNTYQIVVDDASSDFTVTLRIPTPAPGVPNAYGCGDCAKIDDFTCQYTNASSPDGSLNFFLKNYLLNYKSWWQTMGSNVYARNSIQSFIPYEECDEITECQAGLMGNYPETNQNSAGFAMTLNGNILTDDQHSPPYNYVHPATARTIADGATATGVDIPQKDYQYFNEELADVISNSINSDTPSKPSSGFYKRNGDLTIGDSGNPGWGVNSGESIVILVNGSLTIDNQGGKDQIIKVAPGGYLALIVKDNIIVTEDVGYLPGSAQFTSLLPNVEGVFITGRNGQIIIRDDGDPTQTDRKFIGAGTFVGWGGIQLMRNYQDSAFGAALNNTNPAEIFIFRPDFVVNTPVEMKSSISNWREVDPSF